VKICSACIFYFTANFTPWPGICKDGGIKIIKTGTVFRADETAWFYKKPGCFYVWQNNTVLSIEKKDT